MSEEKKDCCCTFKVQFSQDEPLRVKFDEGNPLKVGFEALQVAGTKKGAVLYDREQELTADEMARARENIGAVAADEVAQPDYGVNDESNPAFVKNRPFYDSREVVELFRVEDYVPSELGFIKLSDLTDISKLLRYTVTVNGTDEIDVDEPKLTDISDNMRLPEGSWIIISSQDDIFFTELFCFATEEAIERASNGAPPGLSTPGLYALPDPGLSKISYVGYGEVGELKQIEPKFIDVPQSDWNVDNEADPAFVKNRPFYKGHGELLATLEFHKTANGMEALTTNEICDTVFAKMNTLSPIKLGMLVEGVLYIPQYTFRVGWFYFFNPNGQTYYNPGQTWSMDIPILSDTCIVELYDTNKIEKPVPVEWLPGIVHSEVNAPIKFGDNEYAAYGGTGYVNGKYSLAYGEAVTNCGYNSIAFGTGTVATKANSITFGKYNVYEPIPYRSSVNPQLSTNIEYMMSESFKYNDMTGKFTLENAEPFDFSATNCYVQEVGGEYKVIYIESYQSQNGIYVETKGKEYRSLNGDRRYNESNYAIVVGNGVMHTSRSNAHTLDKSGNAWYAGDVYVGSTSGTNRDEGSERLVRISEVAKLAESAIEEKIAQALSPTYAVIWAEEQDDGSLVASIPDVEGFIRAISKLMDAAYGQLPAALAERLTASPQSSVVPSIMLNIYKEDTESGTSFKDVIYQHVQFETNETGLSLYFADFGRNTVYQANVLMQDDMSVTVAQSEMAKH